MAALQIRILRPSRRALNSTAHPAAPAETRAPAPIAQPAFAKCRNDSPYRFPNRVPPEAAAGKTYAAVKTNAAAEIPAPSLTALGHDSLIRAASLGNPKR